MSAELWPDGSFPTTGRSLTFRGVRSRARLPEADEASSAGFPCVVHLVRAANGLRPLRAFATALRRHPPGACELVLVMKGFKSAQDARAYLEVMAEFEPKTLFFSDYGGDLSVYLAAATRLRRARYCFLNSFSVPLVDGWLAKLDAALNQPRSGLVGATGSWSSTLSWAAYSLGLPSAYRGALPPAQVVRRQLLTFGEQLLDFKPDQPVDGGRHSLRATLGERMATLRLLADNERFPAYHLRTNAFMISHATLTRLRVYVMRDKLDALALESGRNSITRQVQRLGLRTLIVDRTGAVFDQDQWDRSRTLYQGDQEGLLVADNRTVLYERGDATLRRVLSGLTWGSRAQPTGSQRASQSVGSAPYSRATVETTPGLACPP